MREREIFITALQKDSEAERAIYLESVCGHNSSLRTGVEALLREHEKLGSFIESPAPALMAVVGPPDQTQASEPGMPTAADRLETHVLGDYRIIQEIGRGGMGVVYEAEQTSLGRHVALKVLPFTSMLDKTQLARFKNEARAAASLDHPNVVHVHSVGSERGVHYYAMQLIDGQTVGEVITAERRRRGLEEEPDTTSETPVASGSSPDGPTEGFVSSGPPAASQAEALKDTDTAQSPAGTTRNGSEEKNRIRRVMELAIQAAEALEHAHRMGIVHRDVKPSNLMVDAEDHLWITDFGLAMVEAEPNITATGGILGTLRYMSPEQMRGDRHVLDHRTDIYSLGVTLYEMLMLQPAFPDSDAARLMQRIPSDEPTAPRKLSTAIPRDLETIVLKAMAKEARDRYPSVGELADDLRRLLADEPIQARRPGLVERTKKWARRHRPIVATATATLALAAIIAGGLLWRERSQTLDALDRMTEQRERADEQGRLAEEVVDRFYVQFADRWARQAPGQTLVQRDFLEAAVAFYEQLAKERGTDEDAQFRIAVVHNRIAHLYGQMGEREKAELAYRTAIEILEELTVASKGDRVVFESLVNAKIDYGFALLATRKAEAENEFREALALLDPVLQSLPTDPDYLHLCARAHSHLGIVLSQTGRNIEAESACNRAIETFDSLVTHDPEDNWVRCRLAFAHQDLGRLQTTPADASEEHLQTAIDLLEGVVQRDPYDPTWKHFLARPLQWKGDLLASTGCFTEAEECYRDAFNLRLVLATSHPQIVIYQEEMNRAAQALVNLCLQNGDSEQVVTFLKELDSLIVPSERARQEPAAPERAQESTSSPSFLVLSARTHNSLGDFLYRSGRLREAGDEYRQAIALYAALVSQFPSSPGYVQEMTKCCGNFRRVLSTTSPGQARQVFSDTLMLHAGNPALQNALAWGLATSPDPESRDPVQAVELATRALEWASGTGDRGLAGMFANTLGVAHYRAGNWDNAIAALQDSIEHLGGEEIAHNASFLAMSHWQLGSKEEARSWYHKAVAWTAVNKSEDEELRRFCAEAAEMLGMMNDD
jgi:hypothetical protein